MADQPAKKQKTDDGETMGISEMKALIKSAGLSMNLLDRPAEQIGSLLDGAPDHAATVNTLRRGLREFGLSA